MDPSSHSSPCFSASFLLLTFSDSFSVIERLYSLFPSTHHLLSLLRTPKMCRVMVILHFSKSPNQLNQLHPLAHVQRANERPKRDSILSPSQVLDTQFFGVFVILCVVLIDAFWNSIPSPVSWLLIFGTVILSMHSFLILSWNLSMRSISVSSSILRFCTCFLRVVAPIVVRYDRTTEL